MTELLSWTDRPDCEIIPRLLALHAPARDPLRLLDCTYNRGYMWRGTHLVPLGCDRSRKYRPRVVADCRALPFRAASWEVVFFDPPHGHGSAARRKGHGEWAAQYGLGTLDDPSGAAVADLFAPFLTEAARVLVPGGIIIAKLADEIYQSVYRFALGPFWQAVEATPGLRWEDMQVKIRAASGAKSGRWHRQYHTYRAHSYWIVVRKGGCQGHGLTRVRPPVQVGMFA